MTPSDVDNARRILAEILGLELGAYSASTLANWTAAKIRRLEDELEHERTLNRLGERGRV